MNLAFDLRDFAVEHYRRLSSMRWLMVVLGGVWVVLLAWFVSIQLTIPHPDPTQWLSFLVVYLGLGFAVGLSVWSAWMARLGPVALKIVDEGLEFKRVSGSPDLLRWRELPRGVVLVDFTVNTYLSQMSRRLWQIRRWNRPPTDLTKAAFETILAEAPRHNLTLTSALPTNSRWGRCRVIRFAIAKSPS